MLSAENVKKLLSDSSPLVGNTPIEKDLGRVLARHLLDEIGYWLGANSVPEMLQISFPYNEEGFHKYSNCSNTAMLLSKYSSKAVKDTWYHFGNNWFNNMGYSVFFYLEDGEVQITLDWGANNEGE